VVPHRSREYQRTGNHNSKIAGEGREGETAAGWAGRCCTRGMIVVRSVAMGALFLAVVAVGFLVLDLYT
jgi:hypothetical protein